MELQEQVVDAHIRLFGNDHQATLQALQQLAQIQVSQSKYQEAEEILRKVAALRSSQWGTAHPDTLTARYDLAQVFRALGNLSAAKEAHAEILSLRKQHLGSHHPDTIRSFNRVSETLIQAGDLIGAEELQRQSVDLSREFLGREHPLTTESAWILSHILKMLFFRNSEQNLSWLFDRDPRMLYPWQRNLRRELALMIGRSIEEQDKANL
jgi:tetratricopeptide (TPR) repeat protein